MAVLAESLITPEGEIDPNLFPDDEPPPESGEDSLIYRLETYIRRAEDKVAEYALDDPDPAVEHWALYLAFKDAHTGMIARPATEQYLTGLGGHGYSSEQIKAIAAKVAEHKAAYEAALALAVPSVNYKMPQSRTVTNKYEW